MTMRGEREVREMDDVDEVGNVLRVQEWELAL
jgi:hypothetical protein